MVNWQKFKITNWKTENKYNTTFCLDGKIYYKGGNTNAIFCSKPNSFSAGWKIGDYLEIDLDGLGCRRTSDYLEDKDKNIVRKVSSTNDINDLKQSIIVMQIESISLSSANNSLSKTLNNFYKEITEEDEDFVSHYFHPLDLSECREKLSRVVDKFSEIKRKNRDLERELTEWKTKYYDKNRDYEEEKEKREELQEELDRLKNERLRDNQANNTDKLRLERENSTLRVENTRLQERLESSNAQVIDLTRRLENKEEEVNTVRREKENQTIIFESELPTTYRSGGF